MKKTITFLAMLLVIGWAGIMKVNGQAKLYGMTAFGGTSDEGVLFEWDLCADTYTKIIDFNAADGRWPIRSSLSAFEGKLYGMTSAGGDYAWGGVIFEWDPVTNIYTKKHEFIRVYNEGLQPHGMLTLFEGKFYGTTSSSYANQPGVIFEWDPVTNIYTKKYNFTYGDNGCRPDSYLSLSEGKFYGTTKEGGAEDKGVIFEWDPVTNIYTKKIDLGQIVGYTPYGSLKLWEGKFYGTTTQGGNPNSSDGVIFEWDPGSNIYTKKYNFTFGADGWKPNVGLTMFGEKFYGMTVRGGTTNHGVIFEWDPATNIYTKKYDFDDTNGDGIEPSSALTLSGGKFYGMTALGGTHNKGVIFEWDPETNIYTKIVDFDGTNNGKSPTYTQLLAYQPDSSYCDIVVDAGDDVTTFFGIESMQSVTRTAAVVGGTAPFTFSWTLGRPLLCNQENEEGDESFYGGTCTENICPDNGSPVGNAVCTGSATITAALLDTTVICVTVTDANGSSAADCFTVYASDARCIAGNSGNHKVKICHQTNNQNNPWIEICVDTNAINAHLAHGDYIGSCYLPLQMVGIDKDEELNMNFMLYPNPTEQNVILSFNGEGDRSYIIEIVDMTGRKLFSFEGKCSHGKNTRELNLENIVPGIYQVALILDGNKEIRKLLVR